MNKMDVLQGYFFFNAFFIVFTICVNQFHATAPFLYPLKTTENLRFSEVFMGYKKRAAEWNGWISG